MSTARFEALRHLRKAQARARARLGGPEREADGSQLRKAREIAAGRADGMVLEGAYLLGRHFRYPQALERQRLAATQAIIERVVPGPDEDGTYLEMIARQAASIEMILRRDHTAAPDPEKAALCDRILLATTPCFGPGAFACRIDDFFNVQISAGLIDFLHQMTKAVVMSGEVADWEHGVRFDGAPDTMDRILQGNAGLERMFVQTLYGYLTRGTPRDARGFGNLTERQEKPAVIQTAFNERFVLAHEYGHTLVQAEEADEIFDERSEEFRADAVGFHLLIQSGCVLDLVPPPYVAQGPFLVLTVLDLLQQARSILLHGEVIPDQGFAGHPPVVKRIDHLKRLYQNFDDDPTSLERAMTASTSLMHLWDRNRATFQTLSKGVGLAPHPMWMRA